MSSSTTKSTSDSSGFDKPLLEVSLYEKNDLAWRGELNTTLEFGRQNTASKELEPDPYTLVSGEDGVERLVIADKSERKISRKHVTLAIRRGMLQVINSSQIQPVICNHTTIDPEQQRDFDLLSVVRIEIGDRTIVIGPTSDSGSLRSLANPTKAPGGSGSKDRTSILIQDLEAAAPETMMAWLSEMIDVLQSAASSEDFLELAAQAVVDIVKLDTGQVLLNEPDGWKCAAYRRSLGQSKNPPAPSQIVLGRMLSDRKTYWLVPTALEASASLAGVTTVIAAPILDSEGQVVAAIYGDRRAGGGTDSISDLEARMVEVLAFAAASGMARLKQAEEALRVQVELAETRTRFEQFFSPKLAEKLLQEPNLLEGRDVEVTVLFCDLRDFTAVSDRLKPREMLRWVNAVQDEFSNCVIDCHGVLVDYVGDELLAMWGAPVPQPDHAMLACQAAVAIVRSLPDLDRLWADTIGQQTKVGIGISTGMALVGNTGSKRKFKYGPLGRTVNVGSRVQDATRMLRAPILITQKTASQLDSSMETRRLGRVRMANLQSPETLFELAVDPNDDWRRLRDTYQGVLDDLEAGRFAAAQHKLNLLQEHWPDDGPSRKLHQRTESTDLNETFDDIWTLTKFD